MRKVDRNKVTPPSILDAPFRSEPIKSELQRAIDHFDDKGSLKGFEYKRYKEDDVKHALERLFHGKCAYCESFYQQTQPVDVEHYRPKGKVQGTDHGGYWWLAADWLNLLPSCIDCNRQRKQKLPRGALENPDWALGWDTSKVHNMGKKDLFPLHVDSARADFDPDEKTRDDAVEEERPLLLDPTRDDPTKALSFSTGADDQFSLVFAKTENGNNSSGVPYKTMGEASIQVYGLNRLGLVQQRTRVLRDLEFLLEMSTTLQHLLDQIETREEKRLSATDKRLFASMKIQLKGLLKRILSKFEDMAAPEAPYSMMVRQWIDDRSDNLSNDLDD